MTWQEFSARYSRQIAGMARHMLARWRAPLAVSVADIEQEITLGAWLAWSRWEAGRGGMSREAFALCAGRLDAQRWLHSQRNAPRRSGKAPGRFPLAESGLGPEVMLERAIEPGQVAALVFIETLRDALRECRTPHEHRAIVAWVANGCGGDVEPNVLRAWRRKQAES